MSQNTPVPPSSGIDSSVTTCANCHSPMPSGLRFCRNCGYRLGEGLAEYTETVRFQNGHNGAGLNSFDTTDRGVTFDNVEPAGSPADKAGLVGGDIITSFDGREIKSDDEMMELLGTTPVGKTVDVVFIRDGETRTTKLTTISKGEFDRLAEAFRNRPEGRGRFGYETDDAEKVAVQGTNMFGVRLGK